MTELQLELELCDTKTEQILQCQHSWTLMSRPLTFTKTSTTVKQQSIKKNK